MTNSSQAPLLSKDPPSYYSIYIPVSPNTETSYAHHNQHNMKRYVKRRCAFVQRLIAATFVAATISTTIMLLLWQLQNLTDPQDYDDSPWFDPDLP